MNFNLKRTVNDLNDSLYNIQSLKQLQFNIDVIQSIKNGAQLQTDMACLALLRRYILDEVVVGPILFRNLIRRYYPLNDEQIVKYETFRYVRRHKIVENGTFINDPREWYFITNLNVLNRRGCEFTIEDKLYSVSYKRFRSTIRCYDVVPSSLIIEIPSYKDSVVLFELTNNRSSNSRTLFCYNYYIDFHNVLEISTSLAENEFTKWDWDLVIRMKNDIGPSY